MAAAAILQSCGGSPSTLRFVFAFQPRRKPEKQSILSYLNWQDLFCLKKFYEMLLDSPTHSICQIGLQDSALALSEEVFDASFCSSISRTSKSSYRLARVQNRKKKTRSLLSMSCTRNV